MTLEPDYSLKEVAAALGMSERWVRQRIKEGAECQRYGHKIKFTPGQVDKLRAGFVIQPAPESITTGRKRRAS